MSFKKLPFSKQKKLVHLSKLVRESLDKNLTQSSKVEYVKELFSKPQMHTFARAQVGNLTSSEIDLVGDLVERAGLPIQGMQFDWGNNYFDGWAGFRFSWPL